SYNDILEDISFNQGKDINEILGYSYNLYNINNNIDLNLEFSESLNVFVPLKYKSDILLNKLGFLIEYEINNEIKYLVIDDFNFFETYFLSIKKINNLKIYTYENY